MMRLVGVIGMREALRLGVAGYSHASDLKDAGISSPTADVAGYVIQGAIEAYRTQMYLKKQNASDALTVTKITLLMALLILKIQSRHKKSYCNFV